jgi:hypothetical protein
MLVVVVPKMSVASQVHWLCFLLVVCGFAARFVLLVRVCGSCLANFEIGRGRGRERGFFAVEHDGRTYLSLGQALEDPVGRCKATVLSIYTWSSEEVYGRCG